MRRLEALGWSDNFESYDTRMLTDVSDVNILQLRMDDFSPKLNNPKKRHCFCMVTIIATAPHILVAWEDHNRTLGIDYIYVHKNGMASGIP